MNVYTLEADVYRYSSFRLRDERHAGVIYLFNGTPISRWDPLPVEADKEAGAMPDGDCPSLISHIPVFSGRAVKSLKRILEPNGQLLPLDYENGAYYAYNVLKLSDALDVEKSEVVQFRSGRIMDIKRYELIAGRLGRDLSIFKLTVTPLLRVFITDVFVEAVKTSGLVGFTFKPVWSSSRAG